jgi:hypothetical protein
MNDFITKRKETVIHSREQSSQIGQRRSRENILKPNNDAVRLFWHYPSNLVFPPPPGFGDY